MRRMLKTIGALALAVSAGCVSSSKYEKKAEEAAQNDTKAQEAAAKAQACETKAAALEQQLATAQQQLQQVTDARDKLAAQAAALSEQKGQLEAKSAEYERLARSLQKEIKAGQIEISELQNKMIVKLRDRILFPSGSAKLSAEGKKALDEVAAVFKDMKGRNVIVGGYTDDVPVAKKGPFSDNWDLSTARASSVVRYIASKGVPPKMLGAAGFSEYRPVAPNDSAANRSQNRRIEIALVPAD
ncbi:MAG TPA: OmpA family protein [Anaeromyxobacteraceae bacterium]|nr:OmpA family protein [Anaeromyxobacteraceae bacterium]